MWRSVSLVLRSFMRAKGFTVAALLTVALGIGVNIVVFSLFDRVLFRPLPYAEPQRLVQLQSRPAGPDVIHPPWNGAPTMRLAITQALAGEKDLFSGIAWSVGGDPEPLAPVPGETPLLWLTPVTTGTLDVLGVQPVIGPGFSAVRASTLERPILVTYETWKRRYGGSDDVLSKEWLVRQRIVRGASLGAEDVHWRVVGVLPEGFLLPSPNLATAPYDGIYGIDPRLERQAGFDQLTIAPFARLAPGASAAAAQARVDALIAARFPSPRTLAPFKGVTVVPFQSGLSTLVRPYLWLAVAGAWAVLGVSCVTLAIQLLTWSQSRRQDVGVRLALGASPRRVVVNALTESSLLCGVGTIIGWLAYVWARPVFVAVLPIGLRSFVTETADLRVIVATCGSALLSAIAAGTLPALRTSRIDPLDVLRSTHDSATLDRLAGGPILLSVQAAIGVMLLVGASAIVPDVLGRLLESPGFDATDLFMVSIPTANDETAADGAEQTRRGLAALDVARRLPGVVDAALSREDPLWPSSPGNSGFQPLSPTGFAGRVLPVDAGFFRTLATPMIAGRAFSAPEVAQQALVAIVNESGARGLWPDSPVRNAIGRTVMTQDGARVIVGVAADVRVGMDVRSSPMLFLPLSANEVYRRLRGNPYPWNSYEVMLRMTSGRVPDVALLSDRLREQSWMLQRWVGARRESVAAKLGVELEKPRFLALIFGTLGGITLLLAIIAMYGLASFEIRRRREEMTVRLALGAAPKALRRWLAIVIVRPVLFGVLAGLPLSWIEVKLLSRSVASVSASDLRIYLAAAVALVVAALLAAWVPGRRFLTMRVAELLRST